MQLVFQYAVFKVHLCSVLSHKANGDGEIRTLGPLLAMQVLSELTYTPTLWILQCKIVKPNGLKWTRTTDLTLIRRAL